MSFCEFHPEYQKHLRNYNFFENEVLPNLQQELQWGLSYRNLKKREHDRKAIPTKKSPVDIPFKLCRERERKRKIGQTKKEQKKPTSARPTTKKLSLLEKSVLSQEKYMEYLSTPNPKFEEPPLKKRRKKCVMEPCSPRLVNLAIPNKRRVYANWKDFYDRLPAEMLLRFEQILYTNNSLEPRDARYYYKKLDKEKKKKRRAKKALKTKKQKDKERNEQKWIKDEIQKTVKAIMDFIKEEPLFVLNYKQLLLSDSILNNIAKKGIMKKPKRNTKNPYRTTIIELSDKLALWMDTLIRFVDVQAVETDEDIPPLTISSIEISSEEEGMEEGESEESDEGEGPGEDEGRKHGRDFAKDEDLYPSAFGEDDEYDMRDFKLDAEKLDQTMTELGEEFGEAGLEEFLGDLSGDQLEKLIRILSNCADEFLETFIDPDNLPDITYRDVLDRLIELKNKMDQQAGQSLLEELMVSWAMQNNPEEVDTKLLNKIKETAAIIEQSLRKKKAKLGDEAAAGDSEEEGTLKEDEVKEEKAEEDLGEEKIDDSGAETGFKEDPLKRLIMITAKSPSELLDSEVDSDRIPGVTYGDVLNRLVDLKIDWDERNPEHTYVEDLLIDWVKQNDADVIDEDLLKKIQGCSTVIKEWLNNTLKVQGLNAPPDVAGRKLEEGEEPSIYVAVNLIDVEDEVPNIDLLNKFIDLVRHSSVGFLTGNIDEEKAPGISYQQVLDRLLQIQSELDQNKPEKSFMDQVLTDWVLKNDPEALDAELRKKIREVAVVLNEWIKSSEVEKSAEGKPGKEVDEQVTENQEPDEQVTDEKVTDEQVAGEEGPTTADVGDSAIAESKDVTTDTKERGEKQRGRMGTQLDLAGFSVPEEEIWGADVPPMWTDKLDQGEEWEAEPESAIEGEGEAEVKPGAAPPVAVIYEKGEVVEEGEEGLLIKGHKPSVIMEHTPNTVCCLSLKIWAVWLLEITHNAHSWTKWVHELIKQVREYAAIVRGDVTLPDGSKKVLRKDDWRKFIKDTDEKIVAWRQYSAHVKDLSISIIENFQGKKIVCCPKCLQDHLIKNVVVAHHTLRALTEAMNCAAYWRRCLDNMVDMTSQLTNTEAEDDDSETDSSETESDDGEPFVTSPDRTAGSCVCSTRLQGVKEESESDDSLYELEELDVKGSPTNPRRRS